MSVNLVSGASRTLFDDTAKEAYQSAGPDLRPCVTFRTTTGSETYNFRTVGRMVAKERVVSQSELENGDLEHAKIPVSLVNIYASDVTDIFDQDSTNAPQEIAALSVAEAKAVKRAETQKVLTVLGAATLSASHVIAHGSVGMTASKLLQGIEQLRANDIEEEICLAFTERQERDLLSASDNKFSSADFGAVVGSQRSMIRPGHFGIGNYKLIGSGRAETGLKKASTTRSCFLFVPSAIGLVVGFGGNVATTVMRNEHEMWRTTVKTRAEAVVIDALGIVEIQCTE
jgi:hypothetical protein